MTMVDRYQREKKTCKTRMKCYENKQTKKKKTRIKKY